LIEECRVWNASPISWAMKLLSPHKVFLLRGNHETRDVNGWEEHYGERSFIYQCRARFGDDLGYRIWEQQTKFSIACLWPV
jgi:hypothetical protein